MRASGKTMVFVFEVLEVFRRVAWNIFRVEWEVVKTGPATGAAPLSSPDAVDPATLPPASP
jgi:hypothetical protein